MDTDYTKRELDHMFGDVHSKLDLILVQTTKHNGRMTKMERWQSYIQGALAVLGIIVIPLLGWVMFRMVNIDKDIALGVDKALSAYEVNIK